MDRRDALKVMGTSLAAAFMMNIAPRTHAAILKDRSKEKNRIFSISLPQAILCLSPSSSRTLR